MTRLKLALVLLIFFSFSGILSAQPELNASDKVSRTGFFQLNWSFGKDAEFVLQQDTTALFNTANTIYTGPDTARTMSGLLNGDYFYRVRSEDGGWSEPVKVTVEHYELSTAFIFLGLGAMVFLSTAILIIRGHRTHRKDTQMLNG